MANETPQYMSLAEAAKQLGYAGSNTLRAMVKRGPDIWCDQDWENLGYTRLLVAVLAFLT